MSAYPYRIIYPESYAAEPAKKWPLLLFLHGAGERGNGLEQVERQGLPNYLKGKKDFPFVVAYPQCPPMAYWQVDYLNQWLGEVLKEVRVDHNRIYLTGISMGGYGTWHWAAANPDTFAAILPICGGGDPGQAGQLAHLPVWAFHGAKDDIVPLSETTEMVEAVRQAGGQPVLTIYPDLYHDSWTITYHNPAVYEWLLRHRK